MLGTGNRKSENSHAEPYPHRELDLAWLSAPAVCTLSDGSVHLWRGWLDQPAWRVQQLTQNLCAKEWDRANRFYSERDRKHFVVARGMLRLILSQYLQTEAGQVPLCSSAHGKPYLQEDMNQSLIRFSVAHSHQLAVYAFTCAREIGIDLEYMRPMPSMHQTAAGFMSGRELALLSALPMDQRQEAFYLCWTCKEAYVKATGVGLGQPLEQLEVSITSGKPARLLHVEGSPAEAERWSLRSFTPAPGYAAAVAVEGHSWDATCWDLATLHPPQATGSWVSWNGAAAA